MSNNSSIKLLPSKLKGTVQAPPSKSYSHRSLIAAALADGYSEIYNISLSDDIKATMSALETIGAKFEITGSTVHVKGVKSIKQPKSIVDCNESGSTIRFLIPILSLSNKEVTFTGKTSLMKRPQTIYEDLFNLSLNNKVLTVNGSLKPKKYYIDGSVSSQFITGLLYTLPLLKGDSEIIITNKLESKSYIDLTIDVLDSFGIKILESNNGYIIKGNQKYKPTNYSVEGDYSQSAFFLVAGVINDAVNIRNLNSESKQGDLAIINVIEKLNGTVIFMEDGFTTTKSTTNGAVIDIADCPDLGPIIALLLSLSSGKSKIINAGRLRIKESDRIESTVTTLSALGANIHTEDDDIIISGRKQLKGGVTVDSYNDHRIAMMVSIAASVCKKPVILTTPNAINKSYPSFYKDYISIGGSVE